MMRKAGADAWGEGPLLSGADFDRARAGISALAKYPVLDATIRFRNALQACLRDLDRAQDAIPPLKILAVDSTEVYRLLGGRQTERQLGNFTFGGLISEGPGADSEFERLDALLTSHLLGRPDAPFLLLDPHAHELSNYGRRAHERFEAAADPFRHSAFATYSRDQRRRVADFLRSLPGSEGANQWRLFKDNLLPDISDHLIEELIARATAYDTFSNFIRRSPYCLVGPASLGIHSLNTLISRNGGDPFPWDEYTRFTESARAQSRALEIFEKCFTLLSYIRDQQDGGQLNGGAEIDPSEASSRRNSFLSLTNQNDAKAFALIDGLNRFMSEVGLRYRVELVSRSPSLHTLLGVLPDGVLNITLRHPLLVPDIYSFDRTALSRLGEALLRVDTLLASAVDLQTEGLWEFASNNFDDEYLHEPVKAAARAATLLLRDRLLVRKTVQADLSASPSDANAGGGSISQLAAFFGAIERLEANGEDVFAGDLLPSLAQKNLDIVALSKHRVFAGTSPAILNLRIIDLFDPAHSTPLKGSKKTTRASHPIVGILPDQFMLVRVTGGRFTREFHIHSARVAEFIRGSVGQTYERLKPTEGTVSALTVVEDYLGNAFSALVANPQPDDVVFNLDATLLSGMAFAHKGRLDTAIALASSMLHRMTNEIRRNEQRGFRREQLRERLAYRELFLFRHYCERALARTDFFSVAKRTADSKGSILRNLARAQRDLDFAALMSEDAERCALQSDQASPAGSAVIGDGRLRLAHIGAWIDQFVMQRELTMRSSASGFADWIRERGHRDRLDIFTAAGLVKEITVLAHHVRLRASEVDLTVAHDTVTDHQARIARYLAHIEVRSLQAALTVFIVFLAYPIVPALHRLWLGDTTLEQERILVFRDWNRWFDRYTELVATHHFQLRLTSLLRIVVDTLNAASLVPKSDVRPSERNRELLGEVLMRAIDDIEQLLQSIRHTRADIDDRSDRGSTFIEVVGTALMYRIHELKNEIHNENSRPTIQ